MEKRNQEAISCSTAAGYLSSFIDHRLSDEDQRHMDMHLSECTDCSGEMRDMRQMRSTLRRMPVRVPPPTLNTRLKVIASRELVRRKTRASIPAMWAEWLTTFKLWRENLMRPLAIPTAGGFVSAILLFGMLPIGMLSPSLAIPMAAITDVPTALYTQASVKSVSPVEFNDEDVVVELTIDDQGQIVNYTIPDCPHMIKTPGLRRSIENSLLFTQFTPATSFGQPKSGKIRLSFRNSRIDVKG